MSIEHDISNAPNQKAALIILGRALDRILEQLNDAPEDPWSDASQWQQQAATWTSVDHRAKLDKAKGLLALPDDRVEIIEKQLAAATDPDDVRALSAALRLAKDAAGQVAYDMKGGSMQAAVPEGKRVAITSMSGTGEVEVVPPTPERERARREWAMTTGLHDFIPLAEHEARDAFAKGGPMWLILGNRDAVMQMPYEARVWLVNDIAIDSEAEAQEVGRDILKQSDSVDRAVTEQAVRG